VLVELDATDVFLKKEGVNKLFTFNGDFQGCLRKNPNAFFARRVIVCEGATEVGICRALNDHRINNERDNLELLAISLVDGTGNAFVDYCLNFKEAGFDVCAFCDSDDDKINLRKAELVQKDVEIIDCRDDNAIEQQLFNDLPWDKVMSLLKYAIEVRGEQSIYDQLSIKSLEELSDSMENRCKIGMKAKNNDNAWFKNIQHGEELGRTWFESLDEIEGTRLKEEYDALMTWIDKG
jgi:predicted ATP-dependent endonuclease of OLD family